MLNIRKITLFLACLALSACSTTSRLVEQFSTEKDFSNLYLRGSINWWEADESYKLSEGERSVYSVIVNLIADGQPYQFKFADKNWTPGYSCGAKYQETALTLGESSKADCDAAGNNFTFLPSNSGDYEFRLDFSGLSPKVSVHKT